MADFPYRAEYSKSNRASCRACRTQIAKDSLRLAALVQSPAFDGKVPHWYHYMCFFGKQRVQAVGDIENFDTLKWDDQEKIKKKVEASAGDGTNGTEKKGKKRSTAKAKKQSDMLFSIEYAKSGRAGCRGCEEKILKGEIRISKMDYESDEGRRYGGIPRWHHVECFTKLRTELEHTACGDALNGFNCLKAEDKENVKKLLPEIAEVKKEDEADGPSAPKKIKTEPKNAEEEEKLKKQNELLYKMIMKLKNMNKKLHQLILEHNDQDLVSGESAVSDVYQNES